MLAFVVDYASLDQDRLFPVEFFVWFTRLDKLCVVCPPGAVSTGGLIFLVVSEEAHKSNLRMRMSVGFHKHAAHTVSEENPHFSVS